MLSNCVYVFSRMPFLTTNGNISLQKIDIILIVLSSTKAIKYNCNQIEKVSSLSCLDANWICKYKKGMLKMWLVTFEYHCKSVVNNCDKNNNFRRFCLFEIIWKVIQLLGSGRITDIFSNPNNGVAFWTPFFFSWWKRKGLNLI